MDKENFSIEGTGPNTESKGATKFSSLPTLPTTASPKKTRFVQEQQYLQGLACQEAALVSSNGPNRKQRRAR